jgi:beta-galactosidase
VIIQTGKTPGAIKFEAKSDGLYTGSTDIFTISPSTSQIAGSKNASATKKNTVPAGRQVGRALGADISFLPQLEERGMKFVTKEFRKMQYKF